MCYSLRHYIARYQQERLVRQLSETLKKVRTNAFEVLEIEPRLVSQHASRVQ